MQDSNLKFNIKLEHVFVDLDKAKTWYDEKTIMNSGFASMIAHLFLLVYFLVSTNHVFQIYLKPVAIEILTIPVDDTEAHLPTESNQKEQSSELETTSTYDPLANSTEQLETAKEDVPETTSNIEKKIVNNSEIQTAYKPKPKKKQQKQAVAKTSEKLGYDEADLEIKESTPEFEDTSQMNKSKYEQLIASYVNNRINITGKKLYLLNVTIDMNGRILKFNVDHENQDTNTRYIERQVNKIEYFPAPPPHYSTENVIDFVIPIAPENYEFQ